MKTTLRPFFSSALLLLATGCCLTLPRYMCRSSQAKAWIGYVVLPMETYWPLNGQTEETRWTDWKECGGAEDGKAYPKDTYKLTDEQYWKESGELYVEVKGCMQKKGYQYVPTCHKLEKCGPPPPGPNGGSWPAWASAVWPPESLGDRPPPQHFYRRGEKRFEQ